METPDSRWAEDRLASLDPPPSWSPNPTRALAQIHARRRVRHRRIAGVFFGAVAAAIACIVVMAASAPQACATPTSCAEHFWQKVFPKRTAPSGKPAVILLGQCAAEGAPFCRARSHFSTLARSSPVMSGAAFDSIAKNQSTSCGSYGYPIFPAPCPGLAGAFEFTIRSPERSRNAKNGTLLPLPPTFAISSLPPGVFNCSFSSCSITSTRTATKYFATIG